MWLCADSVGHALHTLPGDRDMSTHYKEASLCHAYVSDLVDSVVRCVIYTTKTRARLYVPSCVLGQALLVGLLI